MLTLQSVSKIWPNGTEALRRFDLTVADGEIVAIIGGSGCGKTTLLRLIAGLEVAGSGTIRIGETAVSGPSPDVGVVFQEPRLLPWLTVAQNVAFGLGHDADCARQARVNDLLARLRLAAYHDRWPRELSGGQAQRVAIARALAPRPRILLLDEPFSALDALTRETLHVELLDLWSVEKPTMLLVTHDLYEAVKLADRIIVMEPAPGRKFQELTMQRPRPREALSPAFLGDKRRAMAALDASLGYGRAA
jgi:sulfonate transport system ATP-binding protein